MLFVLLSLSSCSSQSNQAGQPFAFPPATVKLGTAKAGAITDASTYTGMVVSRQSVALTPQVDGHVTKIFGRPGQKVHKNQAIVEISPEHQQASVRSYAFAQDSASEDLENARHTLSSLEATRLAKVSALKLAEKNLTRYTRLKASGVVSQEELDTRANTLEGAKSELVTIDAQIRAQTSLVRRTEKVLQASAANLDQQQAQLQYYTIKAPFDGALGDVPVKIGDYVNQQSRLATVTQNHPLEIYVSIPVEKASLLKLNMPLQILGSNNETIGLCRLFFISPNVATDSQTVLVKASYANEKDQLRADQQVRTRIIWSKRPGVLIPTEVVGHQNGQDFVFVADHKDGKAIAKQVAIKLGAIEGNMYQVLEGLKAGEKVIYSGIQNLADGAPIQPTM
jgi:multidrug efflux pump subunit AcrA (membrane-fusion protein)